MKRWEYRQEWVKVGEWGDMAPINVLGTDGWEVVGVVRYDHKELTRGLPPQTMLSNATVTYRGFQCLLKRELDKETTRSYT